MMIYRKSNSSKNYNDPSFGSVNMNAMDNNGWTDLMDAASWGQLDYVKFLVVNGADSSIKNKKGKTAAMLAREKGHKEIADYLDYLDPSVQRIKEGIDSVRKNSGSSLELKPGIRGMLRTGQEYTTKRRGVSYVA